MTKLKDINYDNQRIFINEDLTKEQQDLFHKTRRMAKQNNVKSVWTFNGAIYIKEDEATSPTIIADELKLEQYSTFLSLTRE